MMSRVFQIDTTVAAKSQSFPLDIHIDVTKDLGVTDSATVEDSLK